MSEHKIGSFQNVHEESDSFKGQMEARYRERTFLGLVLPDKSSENHQASSEICAESTKIQMNPDSAKSMDVDSEVSSIFAKRPAMKDLITRFESRGSKKSVSQPVYLGHGSSSSCTSVDFRTKMSQDTQLLAPIKSPQNVQSLQALQLDIRRELKEKTSLKKSSPIVTGTYSTEILGNIENNYSYSESNDMSHIAPFIVDEDRKCKTTSDPVLETINIRNIACVKAKWKNENKYTVHKKEWNKEIGGANLLTVPPSGSTPRLSPRTSTPKPEKKKNCKFDRPRNPRVKSLERPRPHSVQSKGTDKSFPLFGHAPCSSLSLSSQQETKTKTPSNTQERLYKRNIIKEAKKLKSNTSVPDEKKSTAMERYFKFLKSTTPPPSLSNFGSPSTIDSSKVNAIHNSNQQPNLKIPFMSNSTDTISKSQNLTFQKRNRSLSQSPSRNSKRCPIKPTMKTVSVSRGHSPVVRLRHRNKSPRSAAASPRVTPLGGESPALPFKECVNLNSSPVNQDKQVLRTTYDSSSEIVQNRTQTSQISVSNQEDNILMHPIQVMNDTMSDCSVSPLDEDAILPDSNIEQKIESVKVKRLINTDTLNQIQQTSEFKNIHCNEFNISDFSPILHNGQNSPFENTTKDKPMTLLSTDTVTKQKESSLLENGQCLDAESFYSYSNTALQQKDSCSLKYTSGIETDCLIPYSETVVQQRGSSSLDSGLDIDCLSPLKVNISDSFSGKSCPETPVRTVKQNVSDVVNTLLKADEIADNDLLSPHLGDNSRNDFQISENIETAPDDDGYLVNLKMKALRSFSWLQGNKIENEIEQELLHTKCINQEAATTPGVSKEHFEKIQENLEYYENQSDTPSDLNAPYQIPIRKSLTSVKSEKNITSRGDQSPSLQAIKTLLEQNASVDPAKSQTCCILQTLPDKEAIFESMNLSKTPIDEMVLRTEHVIGNEPVAYHFGITSNEAPAAEHDMPLKILPVKKNKKIDKVELLDRTEKLKNTKKTKVKKQKSITDASSEILVIKKKRKKKKSVLDQQTIRHEHEITIAKPLAVKKKTKKDQDEKSFHDIVQSFSQESKVSFMKHISSKQTTPDKSPPRSGVYSSHSSIGSVGSLNSTRQYHSPINRSPVYHSELDFKQILKLGRTKIRSVRRLSGEPTDRFPIWSNIPLVVPGTGAPRVPLTVATCHRRWREDYMDPEKPSKIPLTKSFSATLDNAVVSEWSMHSWCQSYDDVRDKPSLWSTVKEEHLVDKSSPDQNKKIRYFCISRIIYIIMAIMALGMSKMLYSVHIMNESNYKYECRKGDEICEMKDDMSLYLDEA